MRSDDVEELKAKHICCQCVGEVYLAGEIGSEGTFIQCSYCHEMEKSILVEDLADRIETAFRDHYTRTSDQPNLWQQTLLSDRESSYDWERDGEPVVHAIENAAEIPRRAAEDVQAILDDRYSDFESAAMGEETEFSLDTYYDEKGANISAWQEEWRAFEQSLKAEARYFSRSAAVHLSTVFGSIDKLKTRQGRSLVLRAGPRRALVDLYRARVFQSEDKLKEALCRPDLHLGSPPTRLASGGRMNARGIAVFYGATAARVAIAEVRPPVGSKIAVAKFNITRPLRLLDLTALGNAWDGGSIFDPTLKGRLERVAFLQSLGERMTRPVMPDDEAFDYLSTQAIADFLATQNEPQFDGIIFRSVQVKDGRNVVLFHTAARVEAMEFPVGTRIEAHSGYSTEDGWETDFSVSEIVPPPPALPITMDDDGWLGGLPVPGPTYDSRDIDCRVASLRVAPGSVMVHSIDWVSYRSTTHSVPRHRFAERPSDF